jgi:hypothetical protein
MFISSIAEYGMLFSMNPEGWKDIIRHRSVDLVETAQHTIIGMHWKLQQ